MHSPSTPALVYPCCLASISLNNSGTLLKETFSKCRKGPSLSFSPVSIYTGEVFTRERKIMKNSSLLCAVYVTTHQYSMRLATSTAPEWL